MMGPSALLLWVNRWPEVRKKVLKEIGNDDGRTGKVEWGKDRKIDEAGGEDEMDGEWGLVVFQQPCRENFNPQFTFTEIRSFPTIRLQHPRRGNVNPRLAFAEVSYPLY
jgi:hypothetical protein